MALNQSFNQDTLGDIGIAAQVTTSAPTYTTGTLQPLSLGLSGLLRVDGSNVTQPISASTLPLPTGASTSALQSTGNATLLTISGQLPASLGPQASASSFSIVPATGSVFSVSVNDAYAQGSTTSGQLGPLIQGAVTTAAPTYTTATTNPLSLTTVGNLRVDGSSVTQPISAATLPLPTGAATSALQTAGNATLTTISGQLPPALGPQVSGSSFSVVQATGTTFQVTANVSTTGTLSSVALSVSSTTALAANTARKGFIIYNDSLNMVFLAFASTASVTAYSTKLQAGAEYEPGIDYNGIITFVASAATGSLRVTEFT